MEDKKDDFNSEIEQRKKKLFKFVKEKSNLVFYSILALILAVSVYIRTLNISKLKDITTDSWTLAPDLDPFLFLRWAKYIAENGKLFLLDAMRSVPLAEICSGTQCNPVNTAGEMKLLSYMIAYLYKVLAVFNEEITVTYAAIIFPVFMAVLTGIAFFIFTRKVFYKEDKKTANIIALIGTLFFVLAPSLLSRSIAGVPEKESVAFFFLFMTFYFFLEAYTSEKLKNGIYNSLLAGIMTGLLGLTWGGVTFGFLAISGAVLFCFLLGKIDKRKFLYYTLWILGALVVMMPFSIRYTFESLIASSSTGIAFIIWFILGIDYLLFDKKILNLDDKLKRIKLPKQIISLLVSMILGVILATIFFGVSFVPGIINDIIAYTIHPFEPTRFGVTVAENKQPYFNSDWISEFGPKLLDIPKLSNWVTNQGKLFQALFNLPFFFGLFFLGSIFLFWYLIKSLTKKEKIILIASYTIFLICLIFSKYSSTFYTTGWEKVLQTLYFFIFLVILITFGIYIFIQIKEKYLRYFEEGILFILVSSILLFFIKGSKNIEFIFNGESILSLLVYFGGAILFISSFCYVYYKRYKEGELNVFKEFEFSYLFYFVILTMMIVAARGAVRLIMVLGAVSPIAVAFLIVKISQKYFYEKEESRKFFIGLVALILVIASAFTIFAYYQSDKNMAENYAPSLYQWQWQEAMSWVRENIPIDAVFAHWWDYGYWVQSIGERATILDGGNAVGYWNHFMGRLVLTGENEREALNFLYAHNGTHLLIDSTEIEKYGAFSSIGSDENYDKYSWIPTLLLDETQTQETNNETAYVYPAGSYIDEDITINSDGKEILLPRKKAILIAVIIKENSEGKLSQPIAYFYYNNKQYSKELRYIYTENKLHDFKTGLDAGIFVFPRLISDDYGNTEAVDNGAVLYLSPRTINSRIARLYLFGEDSNYFKLVHSQDNLLIQQFKEQGFDGDFLYYNGFLGPIKIWEIDYPSDMKLNEDYLITKYPAELQEQDSGEY